MENTQEASVTIKNVEIRMINNSMIYTLDTTGGKFQFWDKKQDGSDTKAMEQFKKFNFRNGDRIDFSYVSKETGKMNTYTNKPFVNNTILFFNTSDPNTPNTGTQSPQPQAPQSYSQPAPTGSNSQWDRIESKLDQILAHLGSKSIANTAKAYPEIPTINIDDIDPDEIRIEDVPF